MVQYKVSVIIPIFNDQDTIKRSIDSVIKQTIGFSNIELILYDDNSTDNSRQILEEYAEKYENIILILADENSGYASKGRNEGIKRASADYIMFMDSDDEYRLDICETLYDEIIKENADIVSCNFLNIDNLSSKIFYNNFKTGKGIYKDNKIIFIDNETFNFNDGLVWSKIYRKSIIIENQIEFPKQKIAEDGYFIFLLLCHVHKIIYLKDYIGYLRHINKDSLSNKGNYMEVRNIINVCFDIYSFYKNNKKNMDFSWISSKYIELYLRSIYKFNILDNKDEVNDLLDYLYTFENKTNFNDSYLELIYKIPNKLIMKKQFSIAILYLKIIRKFYRNQHLKKVYRIFGK